MSILEGEGMKGLMMIVIALALAGCGSIPKPPQCDDSNKRPLNQAKATQAQKVDAQ